MFKETLKRISFKLVMKDALKNACRCLVISTIICVWIENGWVLDFIEFTEGMEGVTNKDFWSLYHLLFLPSYFVMFWNGFNGRYNITYTTTTLTASGRGVIKRGERV